MNSFPQELLKEIEQAFTTLNTLLERSKFAAGEKVTIADFCLITCVTTLDFYVPANESKYPRLAIWVKEMKSLPCYSMNEPGLQLYKAMATQRLKQ